METYLKMLDFPEKCDKTSRLLRNTQREVSFHIYRSFGIIHIKCCVRLYLVFVFLKGQYESKYGLKSNNMKGAEKNLLVVAYFSINGRFCLISLGNPTFSNIFPRARHVLITFESWTLYVRLCIFLLYISHLLLSSQQASIAMWTILISKSWWWWLKPKH